MKHILLSLVSFLFLVSPVFSQKITEAWLRDNYNKREVYIEMRDGISLFTAVYEPKERSVEPPILMLRTPYACKPYGEGYSKSLYNEMSHFVRDKYIIVFQDVRGKYMSGGKYENVRPFIADKTGTGLNGAGQKSSPVVLTDEASDAYDTVEWLVNNTANNGNVGVYGVSYPGFYATMAALSGHPAIKAVSPQAPVSDWYVGDDVHRNGVFMLSDIFGASFYREIPTPYTQMPPNPVKVQGDLYSFYYNLGTTGAATALIPESCGFWHEIMAHPDYDEFWKARNILTHLKNVKPAVLVVGGMYDTDDCYGALETYRSIVSQSPQTEAYLVYGPWYHGGWHNASYNYLGDVWFGGDISAKFMAEIEYPFFTYYLENKGERLPKVQILSSGGGEWTEYEKLPSIDAGKAIYLVDSGGLSFERPSERKSSSVYVSDPHNPVPFVGEKIFKRPKEYMLADQRFACEREDVLTFVTEVLEDTLKLEGPLQACLAVASSTEDADFIVKLIDVYPEDFAYGEEVPAKLREKDMGGYHQLLRLGVCRARYRNGLDKPEPMKSGKPTRIEFRLDDIAHWLLPGHRLMVQIQSSAFPLMERNPQKYVENIHDARVSDFTKAEITVYHQKNRPSYIILPVR